MTFSEGKQKRTKRLLNKCDNTVCDFHNGKSGGCKFAERWNEFELKTCPWR